MRVICNKVKIEIIFKDFFLILYRSVDYVYLPAFDLRGFWNNFVDVHTPMGRRSFESDNFANFNVVNQNNSSFYRKSTSILLCLGIRGFTMDKTWLPSREVGSWRCHPWKNLHSARLQQ